MDNWYGFTVSAAGEIEGGPEGWTASLSGTTYTVTHGGGTKLVPVLAAIVPIVPGAGPQSPVLAQPTRLGVDSFSWYNTVNMQGRSASYATAINVIVPPEYFA